MGGHGRTFFLNLSEPNKCPKPLISRWCYSERFGMSDLLGRTSVVGHSPELIGGEAIAAKHPGRQIDLLLAVVPVLARDNLAG
jgi:hypothetical protein